MSKKYFDTALNDHNHANPQRKTVKAMMDHHESQAIDVGVTRADPSRFRFTFLKKFQGMLIRDRNGISVLTVTDPENQKSSSSIRVSPENTVNEVFELALELANQIIDKQVVDLYRKIGFVENG